VAPQADAHGAEFAGAVRARNEVVIITESQASHLDGIRMYMWGTRVHWSSTAWIILISELPTVTLLLSVTFYTPPRPPKNPQMPYRPLCFRLVVPEEYDCEVIAELAVIRAEREIKLTGFATIGFDLSTIVAHPKTEARLARSAEDFTRLTCYTPTRGC
jgi:hypothetical protein